MGTDIFLECSDFAHDSKVTFSSGIGIVHSVAFAVEKNALDTVNALNAVRAGEQSSSIQRKISQSESARGFRGVAPFRMRASSLKGARQRG
ncbi:MAG: hypothetical protein AB1813_19305 [Verrucomicrobiota bacterium]